MDGLFDIDKELPEAIALYVLLFIIIHYFAKVTHDSSLFKFLIIIQ